MATIDDADRQRRLSSAILTVVSEEISAARTLLDRVAKNGEPWDENELLAVAALRVVAADRDVLAAVNNAAQVLLSEAEVATEAMLRDVKGIGERLGRLPPVDESLRTELQDRMDYLAEMVEAGPANDDARKEVREIMGLLDGVLSK